MTKKTNAKSRSEMSDGESVGLYEPSESMHNGIRDFQKKKGMRPDIFTLILDVLYEKSRKRVSTYYCPNVSCRGTFWEAEKGYACPQCGTLGIISEFKYNSISKDTKERNIVGYVDALGRLICSDCILNYGVQNEIGLIVYDDTEPFCFEQCELCKEPLGSMQD